MISTFKIVWNFLEETDRKASYSVSIPSSVKLNKIYVPVKTVSGSQTVKIQLTSNDPFYTDGTLWGMCGDQTTPVNPYGSHAAEVWAAGYVGTTKVVMGVIDTGIDYTHPDLYQNIWLNQGEIRTLSFFNSLTDTDADGVITFRDLNQTVNKSFVTDVNLNGYIDAGDLLNDTRWENLVDDDGNGFVDDLIGWDFANNDNDPYDDNQHGTHCSGTIGGMGGNGIGVAGVNWNILLMPLKFLSGSGSGTTTNGALSLDYYNYMTKNWDKDYNAGSLMNYIGTSNSWGGGGYNDALYNSIVTTAKYGNFYVAAAGNSSSNNDNTLRYPSNYDTLSAAGWDAVVAVAAITSDGSMASFSNYGATTVDLGAPGVNIYSTIPGGYGVLSGTSMATPHVAGAIALMAATFPNATAQQLKQALFDGTVSTSSLIGKTVTGGRLDVSGSLNKLAALLGQPLPVAPPPPTDPGKVLWGTTGNDNIVGGSGPDQISGVGDPSVVVNRPGRGQIDVVTGGGNADIFVLADGRGVFYNDGVATSFGTNDYMLIKDFDSNVDKLQVRASAQYLYRNVTINTIRYTEVYLSNGDKVFSEKDELIARLEGTALAPTTGVSILNQKSWLTVV